MEIREPKKKRVGTHIKPQQPFPIIIESESGFSVDGELWPVYTGNLIGDNVIVYDQEEMVSLYTMGFFGKGSFSRGYPSFSLTKKGIPPIIKERQWQRRSAWMEKIKRNIGFSSSNQLEKQDENVEINSSSKNKESKTFSDSSSMEVVKDENADKNPDMVADKEVDFEGVQKEIEPCGSNRNELDALNPAVNLNDNSNCVVNGDSVLVLDDSDTEDFEKVIRDPKPHIEVEPYKTVIETLNLTLEETFFLSFGLGCLQVINMLGELLSIQQLWQTFCEIKPDFIESYVVYHYFRAKGWVVKSGYKFGGDFSLYKQGPPFYHASCVVLFEKVDHRLNNGNNSLTWTKLHGLNRLAENSGKDIVICQVLFPKELSSEDLRTPKSLPKFQVNEMLLKRWVSSQERTENKDI